MVTRGARALLAALVLLAAMPAAGALAGDSSPSPIDAAAKTLSWPKLPVAPLALDYPSVFLVDPPTQAGLLADGVATPIELSTDAGALVARGTGAQSGIAARIANREASSDAGDALALPVEGSRMVIDVQGFQPGSVISVWTSPPTELQGAMVAEMTGRDAGRWTWTGQPEAVHVTGTAADGTDVALTIPVSGPSSPSATPEPSGESSGQPTAQPSAQPTAQSAVPSGGASASSAPPNATPEPSASAAPADGSGTGGSTLWVILLVLLLIAAAVLGLWLVRRRRAGDHPSEPSPGPMSGPSQAAEVSPPPVDAPTVSPASPPPASPAAPQWSAAELEAEAQAQLVWDAEIASRRATGDRDWLQ